MFTVNIFYLRDNLFLLKTKSFIDVSKTYDFVFAKLKTVVIQMHS